MEIIFRGNTKLLVSRLCYGTVPFTVKMPDDNRSQGNVSPEEGGKVLRDALQLGVNFWDTSDDYGTHPHIRAGLSLVEREDVVVADKTYAKSYEGGKEAIDLALEDLGTDYIDLMFLHYVPPSTTIDYEDPDDPFELADLNDRAGALEAFLEAKEKGKIKAIGLSAHSTRVLEQVFNVPEIDVVCTTFNKDATFIDDGTLEDHVGAIKTLKERGKGVYVIKILVAGELRNEAESAIKFALQYHNFIDAWNIGMYDTNDVQQNLKFLEEVIRD
jgi:aryl-alcohol dehydrogenase-like predicted oxidoreductase